MGKGFYLIILTLSMLLVACREKRSIPPLKNLNCNYAEEEMDSAMDLESQDYQEAATDYAYDTPNYAMADVVGPVERVLTTEFSATKDTGNSNVLIPQSNDITNCYYFDFSENGDDITNISNSYTASSYSPTYYRTINIGINLCNYPETRETIYLFLTDPSSKQTVKKDNRDRITERKFTLRSDEYYADQVLTIRYEWKENRIVRICSQTKEYQMIEVFEYNSKGYLIKTTCSETVVDYTSVTTTRYIYTKFDSVQNWVERKLICETINNHVKRASYFVQRREITYYEESSYSSVQEEVSFYTMYFGDVVQLSGIFHAERQPDDPSNPFACLVRFYKMTLSVSPFTATPRTANNEKGCSTLHDIRTIHILGYEDVANKIESLDGKEVVVTGKLSTMPDNNSEVCIHVERNGIVESK